MSHPAGRGSFTQWAPGRHPYLTVSEKHASNAFSVDGLKWRYTGGEFAKQLFL